MVGYDCDVVRNALCRKHQKFKNSPYKQTKFGLRLPSANKDKTRPRIFVVVRKPHAVYDVIINNRPWDSVPPLFRPSCIHRIIRLPWTTYLREGFSDSFPSPALPHHYKLVAQFFQYSDTGSLSPLPNFLRLNPPALKQKNEYTNNLILKRLYTLH